MTLDPTIVGTLVDTVEVGTTIIADAQVATRMITVVAAEVVDGTMTATGIMTEDTNAADTIAGVDTTTGGTSPQEGPSFRLTIHYFRLVYAQQA